jgi:hypothetical protein
VDEPFHDTGRGPRHSPLFGSQFDFTFQIGELGMRQFPFDSDPNVQLLGMTRTVCRREKRVELTRRKNLLDPLFQGCEPIFELTAIGIGDNRSIENHRHVSSVEERFKSIRYARVRPTQGCSFCAGGVGFAGTGEESGAGELAGVAASAGTLGATALSLLCT